MAAAHVDHRLLDAFHRNSALGWVVARHRVDGDKVGAHASDMVEYHVDHHLVIAAARSQKVDEHYAVEGAERMVGNGDKRALGQVVEHVGAVNTHRDVEIIEQPAHKSGSRRVEVAVVQIVDIVEFHQLHQCVHQFGLPVEKRHHLLQVVIVEYGALLRLVVCVDFRSASEQLSAFGQRRTFAVWIFCGGFGWSLVPRDDYFIVFLFHKLPVLCQSTKIVQIFAQRKFRADRLRIGKENRASSFLSTLLALSFHKIGCASGKKIEQALFFPLSLHYLCNLKQKL